MTRERMSARRWSAGRPSCTFFLPCLMAKTVAPLETKRPCFWGAAIQQRFPELVSWCFLPRAACMRSARRGAPSGEPTQDWYSVVMLHD